MSKIKQVLQMYRQGVSNRRIAKELGLYKGTVNDYVRKIKENNFDIDALLVLEDPVLEAKFIAGTAAYTEQRFEVFKEKLPYFEKELNRANVTRHLLWSEYRHEHFDGYSYTQFCFHLNQLTAARHPSAVLEHHPAEKLYVDFAGDTIDCVDRETGELVKTQVFVACLPYSDYAFIMAVPSQSTEDFLYALSHCLRHLGGSPKIVVPDNLKAAVVKADRYEPELNRVLEDFANHYGFVVLPARVRKPKDKSSVENQVKIIYTRVYAKLRNDVFFSIEDLNKALWEKTREHNQTRMQQKGYSREERFLAEEKAALKELPATDFEMKYYTDLRVAQNNCIYLGRDKHYYSVPYTYIGRKVSVIYTRSLVQIFCDGQSIATHPRAYAYGYSTLSEHLCSTHKHYRDRSPEYYIQTAEKRSAMLAALFKRIFNDTSVPEVLYKRCDGLLSLQRKTDPVVFEKACKIALEQNLLTYRFLQRVIENKALYIQEDETQEQETCMPRHENIRGKIYYY
ncbi:transposase [Bacteroidia bacterium]|nr:transposase [Bacteroidia bacterium]